MRVDSHDHFDDVATFDPATGRLEEFHRADRGALPPGPLHGHYSRLSGILAVFYRNDGFLWLRVGREARNLDREGCEVRWQNVDGSSSLQLFDRRGLVTSVEYRPGTWDGSTDPTPFAESEDWDFGLFVTNVLADDARRARMYTE